MAKNLLVCMGQSWSAYSGQAGNTPVGTRWGTGGAAGLARGCAEAVRAPVQVAVGVERALGR